MKGAEKASLFTTGQYGRLYITSGGHARGKTLRIQVLPEGVKVIPNGAPNTCLNNNAVEVYGVISGNKGWTETYGWIHKGNWQEDFRKLVEEREEATINALNKEVKSREELKEEKLKRDLKLLSKY